MVGETLFISIHNMHICLVSLQKEKKIHSIKNLKIYISISLQIKYTKKIKNKVNK